MITSFTTNIDIMFGDKFYATLRKVPVCTLFKEWWLDLADAVLERRPSLKQKDEFDIYFKTPDSKDDIKMTIYPKLIK